MSTSVVFDKNYRKHKKITKKKNARFQTKRVFFLSLFILEILNLDGSFATAVKYLYVINY